MKVVINACYGGFGISREALIELYKRGSKIVETFKPEEYYGTKDWKKSFEGDEKYRVTFNGFILCVRGEDEFRTDEQLIKLIEEWGSEKVSGGYAKLKIVVVPDDVDWVIDDYDGNERVEEKHREWS